MKSDKNKKYIKTFFEGTAIGLGIILVIYAVIGYFGLLPSWDKFDLGGDILILCLLLLIAVGFGFVLVIGDIKLQKGSKNIERQEVGDMEPIEQSKETAVKLSENVWENYK